MKIDKEKLHGIVVPIITPVTQNEKVDELALRKIVRYLLQGGVHGIFVNSTTGEGVCLVDGEKVKSLEIVVDEVKGEIPVYAGISDTSTVRALENLYQAQEAGADFIVAHPPFYYPPNSQDELVQYYTTLANESTLPLLLYNIPFTTQAPLSLDTVKTLMQIENIVGIKDSSVDWVFLMNLIELKRNHRPDFRVFIGKSHMWTAGILSGADGGLDGISNIIPHRCVKLYNGICNGDAQVYDLQREINEIWRVYECRSFLGGIKTAMNLMGLCEPFTTKPVLSASEDEKKKIAAILKKYQLIV